MQNVTAGTNGADRASISSLKNGMWFVANNCNNFPGSWGIMLKLGQVGTACDFCAFYFVQATGGLYYCQGNDTKFTGWKSIG